MMSIDMPECPRILPDGAAMFCRYKRTAVFSRTQAKGSRQLLEMAAEYKKSNILFLYMVSSWDMGHIQQAHEWAKKISIVFPYDLPDKDSAIAATGVRGDHIGCSDVESVLDCLREAIQGSYHIFIDECEYRTEILNFILQEGYQNWTLSTQDIKEVCGIGLPIEVAIDSDFEQAAQLEAQDEEMPAKEIKPHLLLLTVKEKS